MNFRFESRTSAADNIRRVACEQIALARDNLSDPPDDDVHNGIHEARKSFKRLRGLLRMARPALGKARYKRENVRFRDAGRALSAARDAQALVESVDMLEKAYGLQVDFTRMRPLRDRLTAHREELEKETSDLENHVREVLSMLDEAYREVENWPLADVGCGDLARGVKRVYKRASKGWKQALKRQDPVEMHDWRKRAKYLRYHFQMFKGLDSDRAAPWHQGFKELSDLLGDHHDLKVLCDVLDDMGDTGLDPVAECEFRVLLREQQDALYRDARELGTKLFDDKPGKMRKRVQDKLLEARKAC
ncbi:MAG: CHAD domain-containing protein [Gammaproteobacteria bacterium]|jgi:CHAD domain-containing protein